MTAVLETFSRQYGNMVWKSTLKMKTVQTDQDICQNVIEGKGGEKEIKKQQ